MRYLSLGEVLELYEKVIKQSGGAMGIRDVGGVESAVAQPRATFAGKDLYSDVIEKAATLGFSIIMNHPFVDGNKRIGHAAMEVFLLLNGYEINASVDDQEKIILGLASGEVERNEFIKWLRRCVIEKKK